jgi:hypothetical protein
MKESFRGVKMFKNKIVSSIKESAVNFWSYIYPKLEKFYLLKNKLINFAILI